MPYYLISITLFVTTIVLVAINHKKISLAFKILGVGIILADISIMLLILPLLAEPETNKLVSIFSAFQLGTFDADYGSFLAASETASLPGIKIYFSILAVLTPLVFGGFLLSFFEGANDVINFTVQNFWNNKYLFSELNEESLELAKSISKSDKRALIFLSANSDNPLVNEARLNHFLVFDKKLSEFKALKHKSATYFLMSEKHNENLSETKSVIEKYLAKNWETYKKIKVFYFSEFENDCFFLNSFYKKDLQVMMINKSRVLAEKLLYEYPPFEHIEDISATKEINALIVGCGKIGTEVLRLMTSCCQLGDNYKVSIKVINSNATEIENQIALLFPELKKSMNIEFLNCEQILSTEFSDLLGKKCKRANYICVTLGSDELNLQTALYLRQWYLQNSPKNDYEPFIAVHINDAVQNQLIKEFTIFDRNHLNRKSWDAHASESENYNLTSFGQGDAIFTYDSLLNNSLYKSAINVQTVYDYIFANEKVEKEEDKIVPKKTDVLIAFNANEIDKRSSIGNALGIKYKLFTLGYIIIEEKNATSQEIAESKQITDELVKKLSDKQTLVSLTKLEHDRWNAFQRSEGWSQSTVKQAKTYKENIFGRHKHMRAKLHPCICKWDELDAVSEAFLPDPKSVDFKTYDELLVQKIPEILGLVKSDLNMGGCEFVIEKEDILQTPNMF